MFHRLVLHRTDDGWIPSVYGTQAVTAVPDEKRGERLAVLYKGTIDIDGLWGKLNETDFPKLWIPKREDFFQVPEIPLLGSGKLDLKKMKTMALEMNHGEKGRVEPC